MARQTWNGDEIRELARRYPKEGLKYLPILLGRSPDAISSMASRLGLRSRNRYKHLVLSRRENMKHRSSSR